jgi:hypothetical protein
MHGLDFYAHFYYKMIMKKGSSKEQTLRVSIHDLREEENLVPKEDPLYRFHLLAEPMGSLGNEDIDQVLYGKSCAI